MSILLENHMGNYYLVPSICSESCSQCEEIEDMSEEEIFEKYPDFEPCDCDPDQYYYEYWDGHNFRKIYAEDYWKSYLFEEMETLIEDDGFTQKLCKDENEKFFILSSDERSYHPDKITFISEKEVLKMKKADDIREFLREIVI